MVHVSNRDFIVSMYVVAAVCQFDSIAPNIFNVPAQHSSIASPEAIIHPFRRCRHYSQQEPVLRLERQTHQQMQSMPWSLLVGFVWAVCIWNWYLLVEVCKAVQPPADVAFPSVLRVLVLSSMVLEYGRKTRKCENREYGLFTRDRYVQSFMQRLSKTIFIASY